MNNNLEENRNRFYRQANGLMAIVYIAGLVWVVAQVYNLFTLRSQVCPENLI